MNVLLLYAPAPREVHQLPLQVPAGTTLGEALKRSGWLERFPDIGTDAVTTGIWGRRAGLQTTLREGDRLELYRALRVDPKVARRERFSGQGSRAAGLFAQRRPGSKAGY